MADVVLYPNQSPFGNLSPEYTNFCRSTPVFQSFYTSTAFSLIMQICRLKSLDIVQEVINFATNLVHDGLKLPNLPNDLKTSAEQFPSFLNHAKTSSISDLEKSTVHYVGIINAGMRVIMTQIFCANGNYLEAENVLRLQPISNFNNFFEVLSGSLGIAIEVFCEGNRVVHCKSNGKRLMISMIAIPTGNEIEFAAVNHMKLGQEQISRNALETYPFVYEQESTFRFDKQTIPHAGSGPEDGSTLLEKTLNAFLEILLSRQWQFSEGETKTLKPKLKSLLSNPKYSEKAQKVLKNLNKAPCEHNFQHFAKFQCQKFHCILCIQAEINLKSLTSSQIFCPCKKKITEEEALYYFSAALSPAPIPANLNPPKKTSERSDNIKAEPKPSFEPPKNMPIPVENFSPAIKSSPFEVEMKNEPIKMPQPSGFPMNPDQFRISPPKVPEFIPIPAPSGFLPMSGMPGMPFPGKQEMPRYTPKMESTGTLPKMIFCKKCGLPIKQGDQVTRDNLVYHSSCC